MAELKIMLKFALHKSTIVGIEQNVIRSGTNYPRDGKLLYTDLVSHEGEVVFKGDQA
jgi:hypothetical protein